VCNEASSFLDGDHAAELNAHNHLEKDDEHSLDDLYGVAQRRFETDSRRSALARCGVEDVTCGLRCAQARRSLLAFAYIMERQLPLAWRTSRAGSGAFAYVRLRGVRVRSDI
jgi:hypothetical protein